MPEVTAELGLTAWDPPCLRRSFASGRRSISGLIVSAEGAEPGAVFGFVDLPACKSFGQQLLGYVATGSRFGLPSDSAYVSDEYYYAGDDQGPDRDSTYGHECPSPATHVIAVPVHHLEPLRPAADRGPIVRCLTELSRHRGFSGRGFGPAVPSMRSMAGLISSQRSSQGAR
jgi:hypothetical protein